VEVSFGRWICIALPFCLIGILISWVAILVILRPYDIDTIPIVVYERRNMFGKRNLTVIMLSVAVMLLFASSSFTQGIFGDIGVISLCFVFVVFGSGLLSEVRRPRFADAPPVLWPYDLCTNDPLASGGLQLFVLAHTLPRRRR